MKIATWNIEHLKHISRLDEIQSHIETIDADILILTESDTSVTLDYPYNLSSSELPSQNYKSTERRITIHSKFEIVDTHMTYDLATSICPEVITPIGNLLIYGTIIGIHGNRRVSFNEDLKQQLSDFDRLSEHNLCIAGDFNQSFSDNYYFTKHGREVITDSMKKNQFDS